MSDKWKHVHSWRRLMTTNQQDIACEKGAEKLPKIEGYCQRHPRAATTENVDFSKSVQESEQQQHTLGKELKRKEKHCRSWTSKASCSKVGKCSVQLETAKKGKGKGTRPRNPAQRDDSAERKCTCKAGTSPSGIRRSSSVFQLQKMEIAVMIESVITGISRIANISKDKWKNPHIIQLFTRKRRNDLPVLHEKKRGKAKASDKGNSSVAIVKIANHSSKINAGRLLEVEISRKTTWKPTLSMWCNQRRQWKVFFCSDGNLESEKNKHNLSRTKDWKEQNYENKFHVWVQSIQPGSQNAGHFNAPPYEKQDEFARHKAYKLHKELFTIKGHYADVNKTSFFRNYVLTKAKDTATGLAIPSKGRVYMVDSGALLHMMGLSSLNHKEKKTIRQSNTTRDIQTANGIVVSDTEAKVYIKELGAYPGATFGERFFGIAIVGKPLRWAWLFLFVAARRNSQIVNR